MSIQVLPRRGGRVDTGLLAYVRRWIQVGLTCGCQFDFSDQGARRSDFSPALSKVCTRFNCGPVVLPKPAPKTRSASLPMRAASQQFLVASSCRKTTRSKDAMNGAPGLTTRSKKLLGTKGIAIRSKDATNGEKMPRAQASEMFWWSRCP